MGDCNEECDVVHVIYIGNNDEGHLDDQNTQTRAEHLVAGPEDDEHGCISVGIDDAAGVAHEGLQPGRSYTANHEDGADSVNVKSEGMEKTGTDIVVVEEGSKTQSLCPPNFSVKDALKHACLIWTKVLKRSLPGLAPLGFFVCFYYLPGIILTSRTLDAVRGVLYVTIRQVINTVAFWASVSIIAANIFSFHFAKRGIIFVITLGCLVSTLFSMSPKLYLSTVYVTAQYIIVLLIFGFGVYLIKTSPKPDVMTKIQETYYSLTKDGTPVALYKAMVGMYLFTVFLLNCFPLYLASSIQIQLIFRFSMFPSAYLLSKWFQSHVVFKLPRGNREKRLLLLKICNHFMQFIGRMLLTNLSENSPTSAQFIFANLLFSLFEIASAVSYKYRMMTMFYIRKFFCNCINAISSHIRVPWSRVERIESGNNYAESIQTSKKCAMEEQFSEHFGEIREYHMSYLFDEISSDIYALFMSPILMYFLHPIVPNTSFQTIHNFQSCISQIIVQITFGFIGEVGSLAHKIKMGYVRVSDADLWEPMPTSLLFTYSVFCMVRIHYLCMVVQ